MFQELETCHAGHGHVGDQKIGKFQTQEIESLKSAGCKVVFITPSAEHALELGTNLMDEAKMADAYAVGFETGRALAIELA